MKTIEVMDTKESIWGKKLQSHLHSKDFFDTENYPEANFNQESNHEKWKVYNRCRSYNKKYNASD